MASPKKRPGSLTLTKRSASYEMSTSGTFTKGDLKISTQGVSGLEGFTIADLDIGQLLGKGVSSRVKFARHRETATELALKFIDVQETAEKRSQLCNEVKLLYTIAQGECPNLVRFFGAFSHEGSIVIALEYMNLGSLDDVIKRAGRIPEPILGQIAVQMLNGLSYLHGKGKLHRDIKPQNALLSDQGWLKFTDFGISADLEASRAMRTTFVGTATYMSPERIQTEKYSWPSDIWAVGIMLIEAATGRYPYPIPDHFLELYDRIVDDPAPTLPPGEFSPEFTNFIGYLCNKDPAARLPASKLMEHAWTVKYNPLVQQQPVALHDWLRQVYTQQ